MLTFLHVSKTYPGGNTALSNVNLKISKGEFVFLTGASGAGKTTLLKMIYMDEFPDKKSNGQVLVDFGEEHFDSKKISLRRVQALRRKIGIVFQDFKLLSDRTVFENVALSLLVSTDYPQAEIKKRVLETLGAVGILQKKNSLPAELSGGEQQRAAIARAMIHSPYLLIADEPTGNLDPENASEVFKIFQKINAGGTAVIMATHNPMFYRDTPYRHLIMNQGILQREIL
ncbi:MAG: ATP-binding cassette domain-containing protein [Candidatus Fibromonas sp.]|jgi:cell division transport system ATP-binding protein|nr:ATP-binding cassette domain-containing protein [Candidatus Fibromonas sp.]